MNKAFFFLFLIFSVSFAAQNEITREQYDQSLQSSVQREKTAKESLAEEQVKIENVNREILQTGREQSAVEAETFRILRITLQDVKNMKVRITDMQTALNGILGLLDEEIVESDSAIDSVGKKLTALKANPASKLLRFKPSVKKLDELFNKIPIRITQARENIKRRVQQAADAEEAAKKAAALEKAEAKKRGKAARLEADARAKSEKDARAREKIEREAAVRATGTTTVSGKTYQVRTYRSNGECLWVIAKKVYNDVRMWEKIYEANRDKIKDPNVILPGQILVLPE